MNSWKKSCQDGYIIVDRERKIAVKPLQQDESLVQAIQYILLELRAGAEQKQFDILLVHRFKHIGRTAFESPFAACFFDKTGIEVWAVQEGRWDSEEFETVLSTWSNEMFN